MFHPKSLVPVVVDVRVCCSRCLSVCEMLNVTRSLCWHTQFTLYIPADYVLVTVGESAFDLFSPLSFSVCSFQLCKHSCWWICHVLSTKKQKTCARTRWLKTASWNKHQSSDHLKIAWGLSLTKITCNPIICLVEWHRLIEWRLSEAHSVSRIYFSIVSQTATTDAASQCFCFELHREGYSSNHSYLVS